MSEWPAIEIKPGVASKAMTIPNWDYICADEEIWEEHTTQGRIWTYLHELSHWLGAKCEPCADFTAGEILNQCGWDQVHPEDADGAAFLEAIADTLEFRSPAQAQRAFSAGYHAFGLDGSSLETKEVTFYREGIPVAGVVSEVRPGIWVDQANIDAWDSLFTYAAALGIFWHVNSSFRAMEDDPTFGSGQVSEWNKRHTETWIQNPSPDAPVDASALAELGPAATPGFSEHQSGRAVDLSFDSDANRESFAEAAEIFGIYRDAPTERWHFAWVDPAKFPNGRRKFPLGGVTNAAGNVVAGVRTASDAASGADSGSESNPSQAYLTESPALNFPIVFLLILYVFASRGSDER